MSGVVTPAFSVELLAGRYVEPLRARLRWYDNMMPAGGFEAVQTEFGPVIYAGFAFAPPGSGVRHARKHDYRLMAALNPGVSTDEYDLFGRFLYVLAETLGARPEHLVELTNTFLLEFKEASRSPHFRTPKGTLLTLSWPYSEEIKIVSG